MPSSGPAARALREQAEAAAADLTRLLDTPRSRRGARARAEILMAGAPPSGARSTPTGRQRMGNAGGSFAQAFVARWLLATLLLLASPAWAAITEVGGGRQRAKGQCDAAAGTTCTRAYPANVTSGNLLVVAGTVWNSPVQTVSSVTDTIGTSYTVKQVTCTGSATARVFLAERQQQDYEEGDDHRPAHSSSSTAHGQSPARSRAPCPLSHSMKDGESLSPVSSRNRSTLSRVFGVRRESTTRASAMRAST
jgi:hypothetical protein